MPILSASALDALFRTAASTINVAAVCGPITTTPTTAPTPTLTAEAKGSAMPAVYRLMAEGQTLWVALQTKERYLSQSIEADLMHTGDKLTELIDEELVELGITTPIQTVEHYRSQDKLYTFRSPIPLAPHASPQAQGQLAGRYLLAYEACFRNLGDMQESED
jgi:hypothetical protein